LLLSGFLIDEDAARAAGVSKEDVAEEAGKQLEACDTVARVHTYSELEEIEADPTAWDQERVRLLEDCRRVARGTPGPEPGEVEPPEELIQWLFANGYHRQRSPDLFLQFERYVLPYRTTAASHGSPYCYDRWVPWLLRLPSGRGGEISKPVATVDIAPTVAGWFGLKPTGEIDGIDRGPLLVPAEPAE
ncbi:MAG: hypothetical protein GY856_00195, partial [bacterium]|nr:hypothetical protein [bacterium]